MDRADMMRFATMATALCVSLPLFPGPARAANCDYPDVTKQLKCEVSTHAGRPGKTIPKMDLIYLGADRGTTLEPRPYCYQLTNHKQMRCFEDRFGNDTCALAVYEEFNCGASGAFFYVYKCVRSKENSQIFCRKDEISEGNGDGNPDAAKLRRAMSETAFSNLSAVEVKYSSHVGSYRTELEAYLTGRRIFETLGGFESKLDGFSFAPEVVEAHVAGSIWYRLLITKPTNTIKVCDAYKTKIGGYCMPMVNTLIEKP
jgi:hypothetical protein